MAFWITTEIRAMPADPPLVPDVRRDFRARGNPMPYRMTACRSCDAITTDPEHGPEDEVCYAPAGFEWIDVFTQREVDERLAARERQVIDRVLELLRGDGPREYLGPPAPLWTGDMRRYYLTGMYEAADFLERELRPEDR